MSETNYPIPYNNANLPTIPTGNAQITQWTGENQTSAFFNQTIQTGLNAHTALTRQRQSTEDEVVRQIMSDKNAPLSERVALTTQYQQACAQREADAFAQKAPVYCSVGLGGAAIIATGIVIKGLLDNL